MRYKRPIGGWLLYAVKTDFSKTILSGYFKAASATLFTYGASSDNYVIVEYGL